MRKTAILLLFIPLSMWGQTKTSLVFSSGFGTSNSIVYNLGVSFLNQFGETDKGLRLDFSLKGVNFTNGIEHRAGVQTKGLFPYFYYQLLPNKKSNAGFGIMKGWRLTNNDRFEIVVQKQIGSKDFSFLFNVISPF
jgi:hypothetical protein